MGRLEKIGKIAEHLRTNPWNKNGLTPLGRETDQLSLMMDIECVDKTHDLDLDAMLADLDSVSVVHDVVGIFNHLDRETKQLTDCWSPRFGRSYEN
jgi:hypothetical protein|tara:strand:- start:362 stop:649 length:288 start_codon:yes stop_codon:yes gene_type:complete